MRSKAREALEQLSEEALEKMMAELSYYALSVSSKLFWRTGSPVELPRGETVYSIVSLALVRVLTGDRCWDPQKEPDLKTYLMNVIDSLLSHLARHRDNTVLKPMHDTGSTGDLQAIARSRMRPAVTPQPPPCDPETVLLQQEEAQHKDRALQLLLDVSQDDPLVRRIIETIQAGYGKAGDIATVLGIPVTDVYNAMKRLDRKIVQTRRNLQEV